MTRSRRRVLAVLTGRVLILKAVFVGLEARAAALGTSGPGIAASPAAAGAGPAPSGAREGAGEGTSGGASGGVSEGTSAIGQVRRPARTHTPLPVATDLGPRHGVRHLVLFSVTHCPWCELVRDRHLRHRVGGHRGDIAIVVSEVMIDQDTPVIGLDGEPTTHRELARRLNVRLGPTVMAFDGRGRPVGEPLVGALLEDFYEVFVDRLVDEAVAAPLQ